MAGVFADGFDLKLLILYIFSFSGYSRWAIIR